MAAALPHAILEATRLTRAGRLSEATALLQRKLHVDKARGSTAMGDRPRGHEAPHSGSAEARIIDVEPEIEPVSASAPPHGEHVAAHAAGAGPWTLPGGLGEAAMPQMPETMRGLLDRLKQNGLTAKWSGLTAPGPARAPGLPDGARFLDASFIGEAGSRTYKLYIPSRYRGQPMPLLVMLHGCTQSPDDFAAGTQMNALAEVHGLLVAYPAQATSANAQRCWNWFSPADQQRGQGEPSLIAGITRQVMRDHAVDPHRVYIAGLSAGGAAAAIMGATYPDLYAAVGVHSGLACGAARDVASAFAAMRQGAAASHRDGGRSAAQRTGRMIPTIVFHADRDGTVHPSNGDQVIAQSGAAAKLRSEVQRGQVAGGHAYSRTRYLDSSGKAVLEQWLVHGGGHAWSGGSPAGSYTDPRGPDASREMLRFFLDHPRAADAS